MIRAVRLAVPAALAAALAAGCIQTDAIHYLSLPPRPVEGVEVLPGPPPRPYALVAQIVVEGGSGASYEALVAEGRRKAADLGADAIFVQEAGSRYAGSVIQPGTATTTVVTSPSGSAGHATAVTTTTPGYVSPIYVKRLVLLAVTYGAAPGSSPLPR
jgi:hypothetical protein